MQLYDQFKVGGMDIKISPSAKDAVLPFMMHSRILRDATTGSNYRYSFNSAPDSFGRGIVCDLPPNLAIVNAPSTKSIMVYNGTSSNAFFKLYPTTIQEKTQYIQCYDIIKRKTEAQFNELAAFLDDNLDYDPLIAVQLYDDANVAHNTQFFTFEVSYQLTFRGPSTMVLEDSGTTSVIAESMTYIDDDDK